MAKSTNTVEETEQNAMKKSCFLAGPYHPEKIRVALWEIVARVVGSEYDVNAFWEGHIGHMPDTIFPELVNSELLVIDLRGLNPNVMYELGIRHAYNRPTLHICDRDTKLPWDIDKNFVVRYETAKSGKSESCNDIGYAAAQEISGRVMVIEAKLFVMAGSI